MIISSPYSWQILLAIDMVLKFRMRWAEYVARMGERRYTYKLFVGTPEGRRPLGRPRHRWLDNVRMQGLDGVMWTGLVWLRMGRGRELL
jgi:hypothetical protein